MIQAKRAKCKHKITQRTTNSIFLHKYFWKSPFVELLNCLSANTWMWKRTNTTRGKRTYWTQSEIKQNITKKTRKQLWQIWMCVWNLLFSPRRISREYKQKNESQQQKTTTKQQEQIKREKIYFREQRTNQCQQNKKKKRSAVLPARATTWRTQQKKETLKNKSVQ